MQSFRKGYCIPFTAHENCFLGVAYDKFREISTDQTSRTAVTQALNSVNITLWTFYSVKNLQLNVFSNLEDEEDNYNNTTPANYFLFANKLQRNYCAAFLLLTTSLQETVGAIHGSGFALSEYVIFLIPVLELSENMSHLIYGFNHDLVFGINCQPFSASVVLYTPLPQNRTITSGVGILCYPCIPSENAVVQVWESDFNQILSISEAINSNMRKNIVFVNNRRQSEIDYTKYKVCADTQPIRQKRDVCFHLVCCVAISACLTFFVLIL